MADAPQPRRRSRRDLDSLADGHSDGSPLGDFASEMRSMGARDGVEPNQALTEFVSAPTREPDLVVASATASKGRTPMAPHLAAFAGTTAGRVAIAASVVAVAIGGVVLVNELQDPDPVEVVAAGTPSPSAVPSPSSTPAPSPTPEGSGAASLGSTSTHQVLDAGSVTVVVDGSSVSVVSVDPNPDWVAEIETDEPGEAEVNFRSGQARVDFRAEVEDGQLRIRVRDRRTDTETETFPNSDDPAASPTPDDDSDDDDEDDRSGSNSGSDDRDDDHEDDDDSDRDDDDRSGSNSGSDDRDDDRDDDDRSGSNSGSG